MLLEIETHLPILNKISRLSVIMMRKYVEVSRSYKVLDPDRKKVVRLFGLVPSTWGSYLRDNFRVPVTAESRRDAIPLRLGNSPGCSKIILYHCHFLDSNAAACKARYWRIRRIADFGFKITEDRIKSIVAILKKHSLLLIPPIKLKQSFRKNPDC